MPSPLQPQRRTSNFPSTSSQARAIVVRSDGPAGQADNNRQRGRFRTGGDIMMRSMLLAALMGTALPMMALAQTADELAG
jgi:hypothetical protein